MILAIGDSNCYPACTESGVAVDQHNLVAVMSRELGRSFRCWAKNAASNYWMEHHIEYFLADRAKWPNDTMLVIGWTSWERQEWPWQYQNYSVSAGPNYGVPDAMMARYRAWKQNLTDDMVQEAKASWHDRIYQCHEMLRSHSVPHLFWLTYDSFHDATEQRDWHSSFHAPYHDDGDMYHWLTARGHETPGDDPYHFGAEAHRAWAYQLVKHVRENRLI